MDVDSKDPEVSVIVPARNEESSLGACLQSLVGQSGVKFEVIVVDDDSTDRTREIAQSFAGVRIIEPGPLPNGWIGKNNAVTAGAVVARGQWLLFTDADTVHLPGSLARSLAEAQERGVDLLSYSPKQEVDGTLEKAVMPVIFAALTATFRPGEVSDPASLAAAANGQYILVSRQAYDAVGGHAALATSLLEDVALAKAVKQAGRKIFFRYGGDAVRTRMYRSWPQLVEGWTKNLALLFPSPLRLAALKMLDFISILSGVTLLIVASAKGNWNIASLAIASALIMLVFHYVRIRRAHFSWDATLFSPLGLPLFSYLLWRSWFSYKKGRVSWKGRTYASAEAGPTGAKPKMAPNAA